MSPGLQVFQTLRENEGVVRDDIAKARVLHPDLFEKQQPRGHICVEVQPQQQGAHVWPLFKLPQVYTCKERKCSATRKKEKRFRFSYHFMIMAYIIINLNMLPNYKSV